MIENHNLLIKSMEMSVEEQYFIMKMETDRNSMKDHDFRCCIYADDYFLMCTDAEENAPKVRRGTVRLKMQSRFPWLAGHYKLHFSLAESLMGVMEFQVDEQQDVEIQAINAYGIFDPDDIAMGLLSKGEVICVDRSRIVGRFIGDTEDNVKNLLREAQGNVLFIDEAYSLYSS